MLRTQLALFLISRQKAYCAADVILRCICCILGYCLSINNVASRVQKKKCHRIAYHKHRWLETAYTDNAIDKWSSLKFNSDQEIVV